jgi:S-adenosylmethionine/arginine decarboxylase-like enzyme
VENDSIFLRYIPEHLVSLSAVATQHGEVKHVLKLVLVAVSWNVAIHSVFESSFARLLVVRYSRAHAVAAIDVQHCGIPPASADEYIRHACRDASCDGQPFAREIPVPAANDEQFARPGHNDALLQFASDLDATVP